MAQQPMTRFLTVAFGYQQPMTNLLTVALSYQQPMASVLTGRQAGKPAYLPLPTYR